MLYYERKFRRQGFDLIIGVDEAGRGPLAGPVVSLRETGFFHRIDDSKKLSPQARERAYFEIVRKANFGLGVVNEKIIDRLNILQATRIAMEQAVFSLIEKLKASRQRRIHVIVDGNVNLEIKYPYTKIIRGDSRSKTIASASILAKVTRDRIMSLYDQAFPQYGFSRHKGYPTKMHREALKRFGPSLIHRNTFL